MQEVVAKGGRRRRSRRGGKLSRTRRGGLPTDGGKRRRARGRSARRSRRH
jgi:hypothetical protein